MLTTTILFMLLSFLMLQYMILSSLFHNQYQSSYNHVHALQVSSIYHTIDRISFCHKCTTRNNRYYQVNNGRNRMMMKVKMIPSLYYDNMNDFNPNTTTNTALSMKHHRNDTDLVESTTTITSTSILTTTSQQQQQQHDDDNVQSGNNKQIDNNTDHHIRFRGIGRLYSGSTDASSSIVTGNSNTTKKPQPPDDATIPVQTVVLQRLHNAVVVVVGVGGVGSWTVEALCRSGIGTIVLIDMDDICISNTNRQLHTLSNTIGCMKIDTLHDRIKLINPSCIVHRVYDFVSVDNVYTIFDTIINDWGYTSNSQTSMNQKSITAVLDCIDGAREKAALISYCNHRCIPIVTVGSTAGRTNPIQITSGDITNIYTTMGYSSDRLLTTVRKTLRQEYNFMKGRPFGRKSKSWNIHCVYSDEIIHIPETTNDTTTIESSSSLSSSSSSFRTCDNGILGTASFVTGTFGFVAASLIVKGIAHNELTIPCGTTPTSNSKLEFS
jgi:tRNA threonylcarbamoyladenosine dehydratase